MNTQAFRNWTFTRGNSADAAMEVYFRNSKGIREESSELKKGTIHDSLSHLFTFQTIRVAHVARELGTLAGKNKFMECDPPKDDTWVKSTLYRWIDQVTVVYTKCALCACVSKVVLADCSYSKLHIAKDYGQLLCCAGVRQQNGTHVGSCNESSYRVPGRF